MHALQTVIYCVCQLNTCLQNDINYLFNWSETWLLQFNPAKCMHLRKLQMFIYQIYILLG